MNYIENKMLSLGAIGAMLSMSRSRIYAVKELDERFPESVGGKYPLFAVVALISVRELEAMAADEYRAHRLAELVPVEEADAATQKLIKKIRDKVKNANAETVENMRLSEIGEWLATLHHNR